MTSIGLRVAAVSALALALFGGLDGSRAGAAQKRAARPGVAQAREAIPAGRLALEGVWEPLGGAILDPLARGMPGNKGRPMPELAVFPPYNAEWQARYDKITEQLRAGVKLPDGSARCLPQGMPRMMVVGYPMEIIVQPKKVAILLELAQQRRMIYTDGRRHTPPDEIDPTYFGESIGHWEGSTLVVDTLGIRDDLVFDYSLAPHSDAIHITERIRRVGDTLEDEMTLEDAKAFTKPWQIKRTWQLQPTWDLKEYVCEPDHP